MKNPMLQEPDLDDFDSPQPNPADGRPIGSFLLPPKNDPSILIGNRWLSRGDIAILASTSGMGKSSLTIQAAVTWALGRKLFDGFDPHRPLKSLIIQAEDGDGDIAEVRLSLEHVMKPTSEEKAQIDKNVVIVTDRTHRGLGFRAELKRLLAIHKPDIVWVNPLLAFIGGDVNDSTDVGLFLREQMNSLNEPASFAFIFVHHTSKPPKEKAQRQWNEVMYEMAGSADLTNAARAILSLQATDKQGEFKLVLAKRGGRAGLTEKTPGVVNPGIKFDTPTSVIHVRHSTERFKTGDSELPVIHWERFTAEATVNDHAKGGRPSNYNIKEFEEWIPATEEKAAPQQEIFRKVELHSDISKSGFKSLIYRAAENGLVRKKDRPGVGACFFRVSVPPAA